MRIRGHVRANEKLYVEDVFSAFTYTGNGSTQSIVNGIDLLGKGGLVWIKSRTQTLGNGFFDTLRGTRKSLISNTTAAEYTPPAGNYDLTAFNSDGFSVGSTYNVGVNSGDHAHIGWTFRKAKKFFDVKTYTGNGVSGRQIAHDLGVAPGMVVIKRLNATGDWVTWHRGCSTSGGIRKFLKLNTTDAETNTQATGHFGNGTVTIDPTDTHFTVWTNTNVNANGSQYVAYIFAHDDSADGIIQCGTFTTSSGGAADVTLGWEPQYVLMKPASGVGGWTILDTARGYDLGTADKYLFANTSAAEASTDQGSPNATGFTLVNAIVNSGTYVYMAIRKGLMRPPTDASEVFDIVARTGTGVAATITTPRIKTGVDVAVIKCRSAAANNIWQDRIRGISSQLYSDSTAAELTLNNFITSFNMDSVTLGNNGGSNFSGRTFINYFFKQARGFFDIVGYVGTGAARTVPHNLGAVPELMIVKNRNLNIYWPVYAGVPTDALILNLTNATTSTPLWNNLAPTDTVFSLGDAAAVNSSAGNNYIAYLFASCPGVSKIGTYTGTGAAQNIDCGFTAGARFVMIKRIDGVGSWRYVDSVRGITPGTDPDLSFNLTSLEFNQVDYVSPFSGGFNTGAANSENNQVGAQFLYLAIA